METSWEESGFRIDSGNMASHSASNLTYSSGFWPANGTDKLSFSRRTSGTEPTRITNILGSRFDAISVALAEYSQVFPVPKDITFIGIASDGSEMSVTFTTDGIITGPDAIDDFEIFYFPASFRSLTRLEVSTGTFAMDDLVLLPVPEPSSALLLSLGVSWVLGRRQRRRG